VRSAAEPPTEKSDAEVSISGRPVCLKVSGRALEDEMKAAGALIFGGRLHEPDTATVVRVSDGEVLTTDGPFVEMKEHLGGFYIIEAEDLDGALSWGAKTAECVNTAIEVRSFWDQPGG
jgi:hypothetical protein